MRDRGAILGGLALFVGLITFPVWFNLAAGRNPKGPEPKLPAAEKRCVASTEYMRTSHMDLLTSWREEVVRRSGRTFVASDGTTYNISLTQTCLKCHGNKADFCDRCHTYAGVTPYCWDCHIDPKAISGGSA
jgi:[DsrC]-trisulfide reductase subunit J